MLDNSVILITGATSGIGRELSKRLSTRAKKLVLVATKKEKLEELANELKSKNQNLEVMTEPCDISKVEDIDRMIDSILRRTQVDILINNAGVGSVSMFERSDWDQTLQMINVNVLGLTKLTHKLLPPMIERQRGGIINVASGASFITIPGIAVYNATKQYIHGFTESLIMELSGSGVIVTEVCPGPVASPMTEKLGARRNTYHPLKISADQAAVEIIAGFERRQDIVYPGFLYRWSMYFISFVPSFAVRTVGKAASYLARRRDVPMLKEAMQRQ